MAEAVAQTTSEQKARRSRRTVVGRVIAAHKTPKTIRVEVEYRVRHPRYNKYIRRRTRLMAHDEKQEAKAGDLVELMECRPISRTKKWRLVKVVTAAPIDQI